MTPLSFGFNVSMLGPYIASALSSLLPTVLVVLGLIIGAAVLMFATRLLRYFAVEYDGGPIKYKIWGMYRRPMSQREQDEQDRFLDKNPPQGSIGFRTEPKEDPEEFFKRFK